MVIYDKINNFTQILMFWSEEKQILQLPVDYDISPLSIINFFFEGRNVIIHE
jgi:hypothetical protein